MLDGEGGEVGIGDEVALGVSSAADRFKMMRHRVSADRQAAFAATFGCMTKDEADAFDRVIE